MRIQLRANARHRPDAADEWLLSRLASQGAPRGARKADREAAVEEQVRACMAVYDARRALWQAAVAWIPERLAAVYRRRRDDRDDYSNRKGIDDLRRAMAEWLDKPKGKGAAARWTRRKRLEQAGQSTLFLPEEWPTLSPDNARALARAWPHGDLVADRDGQILLEATAERRGKRGRGRPPRAMPEPVRAARRAFDKALAHAVDMNGKLVIKTAGQFHVGDGMSISISDLLMAGQEGLMRGLMDYQPAVARPSTHLVDWIAQRMRRCLESAGVIHVPTWVREVTSRVRRAGLDARAILAFVDAAETPTVAGEGEDDDAAGRRRRETLRAVAEDAYTLTAGEVDALVAAVASAEGEAAGSAAVGPLLKITGAKPRAIIAALREGPVQLDSLDRRGRVTGDDEDDRPAVVLAADDGDGAEEAEAAVLATTLRQALGALAESGREGQEQAEVLRRACGLSGPEETLAQIAEGPLQSTGRKVNRNEAARLRKAGEAWLQARLAPKPATRPLLPDARGLPRLRYRGALRRPARRVLASVRRRQAGQRAAA